MHYTLERIMTPSTPVKRPKPGSKTMVLRSWCGLLNKPDLNPIEHLWGHLKRRLGGYEEPAGGMLELWERVQKEWEAIDQSVHQNA